MPQASPARTNHMATILIKALCAHTNAHTTRVLIWRFWMLLSVLLQMGQDLWLIVIWVMSVCRYKYDGGWMVNVRAIKSLKGLRFRIFTETL